MFSTGNNISKDTELRASAYTNNQHQLSWVHTKCAAFLRILDLCHGMWSLLQDEKETAPLFGPSVPLICTTNGYTGENLCLCVLIAYVRYSCMCCASLFPFTTYSCSTQE